MRRDVHNWQELYQAVNDMAAFQLDQPRVIVLHDPGGVTYRFVFNDHGLMKIDSDKHGGEL